MIRRLKKVTSQAELQQLIEAGIIVSPYIAFDSSSNVTNMVLPAEREISEIEYEQESNIPIRLVSAIEPDYSTEEGFTVCSLDFTINAEQVAECDELFLLLCRKSYFDNALANSEVSKETLITHCLIDAYNGNDKTLDFSQAFKVKFRNFSFGEDVACKSESYNLAQDDMMFVPYNNTYPNDNTYYLFAGYVCAGDFVSDLVYELAQYRVMPYLSNNAEFVQLGMHVAGTQRGNCVDIDIRVPGNTLYDRVKYGWYLGGYSSEDAIAADRIAVCDATTTFFMSDHNAPEYVNNTDQPLTGYVSVQLFNSVTGVTGAPTAFAMMTVQPSESGGDSSTWWEDFNFDDEPADTDMIEHHEQTPGDEEAMSTLYTLPQSELGIINNALGGNRTLEAAIVVNPTVTEEKGVFSISGGRDIIGDASSNFIAFEDCSIGFDDDSYLVIKSVKNAPANGILSSPPPYETVENYYSILHFGSQDLTLLRIDIDGSNSNWINVNASRWSSNTPIPDASTAWYQNVNFEGAAPNYNDSVDTNAVEEEYRDFADAVSSLMLNDVFNNPEPGETWTNNSVISLVIGGTYSTGYLSGGRQVPGTININAKTITFNNVSFTSDQMIYLVVDYCTTEPCDTPFESYTGIFHNYSITGAVAGQNSGTTCTITATLDGWDEITGFEFDYGNSGEGGDSSTDVSLGYKFTVGQDNTGYFNTGYVPGIDTVVQMRGTIIDDGDITHGIKTGHGEWQYRIFGYGGAVYYDRVDDNVRLTASEDLTVPHDYEFGNFYIKIDGNTVASDTESDLTNFYTEQQLFVFAGSEQGAMGESIPAAYAGQGTQLEYFKILEPDGNGGLNLEMDLRPALDASGNICLYDQVNGDAIYPEGSDVNIIATAISGDEPGPDSSTSEGPTLTFSSTDLTYNTVADFVPVISGDDSYYDSVAFFVIPDSMIADTLNENPGWTIADAVWSLVENEDTRSVGLDSSSGDTVDLSGILNTYYDNQEVYVVALLEHYEVGEYPVYYQPDDEAGNYAYETFAWGEPAAEEEPEEPEEPEE